MLSISRTRLAELEKNDTTLGVLTDKTVSTDVYGKDTTSETWVESATKTTTRFDAVPTSTNRQMTDWINGLMLINVSETAVTTIYNYDNLGRRTEARSDSNGGTRSVASVAHYNDKGQVEWVEDAAGNRTTWQYDLATGLVTNKLYADQNGTAYSYHPDGKLASRTWARTADGPSAQPLVTEYAFDAMGQLTNIHYVASDTPDIAMAYNRLGQRKSVTDAAGYREFEYDSSASLTNEAIWYIEGSVTNHYNLARSVDAHGRNAGYDLRAAGILPAQSVDYAYDSLGRFETVDGIIEDQTNTFTYSWMDGANLLNGYSTAGNWEGGDQFSPVLFVSYGYEPNRNVKTLVENKVGSDLVSSFSYTYDEIARRTDRTDTFEDNSSVDNSFGYNARDEVTSAMFGTDSYSYQFDDIGNRLTATNKGVATAYTPNELNQYTAITGGSVASPTYDDDGNMTGDGIFTYTWNGENRLVMASNATTVVEYAYDYMGRMFRRKVSSWNGSEHQVSSIHSHLWDGWNVIAETESNQQSEIVNRQFYVWGLDLSLTPQGAGGVGGLLSQATIDATTTNSYFTAYDANGNVTDLVDESGNLAAHYEYDAFGNQTASSGTIANSNPWRFSTKYWEPETGLLHYELRPYVPNFGRWLNRDPLAEFGGLNIYSFHYNNTLGFIDYLGLRDVSQFDSFPATYQHRPKLAKLFEDLRDAIQRVKDLKDDNGCPCFEVGQQGVAEGVSDKVREKFGQTKSALGIGNDMIDRSVRGCDHTILMGHGNPDHTRSFESPNSNSDNLSDEELLSLAESNGNTLSIHGCYEKWPRFLNRS
ncbi:RHS repeat domain-containing protein, partial [Pontiella sp.]|uniref:RHS repeat domain-containing protein n=1 Tax=Pontiella sp. TaxID=2837462 RepID=UPI0035620B6A